MWFSSKDNPCKGVCPERSSICHATCKRYADWKAETDAEKAIIAKERGYAREADYYSSEVTQKIRKELNIKQ